MARTRPRLVAALAATAVAAAGVLLAVPALAVEKGTVLTGQATSTAVGTIDYTVYLPPGYDDDEREYPTLYLLHGRGDTQAAWQRVTTDLDELIAGGSVQPMVVVMPDAPWNERGHWYTDSKYRPGRSGGEPGVAVETAFTRDLVDHVDATYRTADDRAARAVGGYSMGGAGALRFVLAHQDTFSAAIVLSAAVYVPQPPRDSSVRDYGAYGEGRRLFSSHRYRELAYPAAMDDLDPALPVHLFIAVGDDEWANPDPRDAEHDLDLESAQLYNAARRVPGITAELRVLNGGHDWDVWQPAFREGLVDVSARLRTAEPEPWEASLTGSAADDRTGGLVVDADAQTLVMNAGASLDGRPHAGGLDVTVTRRDAAGEVAWQQSVATSANDRAYGAVPGADGSVLVAGYTRGNLDGAHPSGATDDGFVAALDADGQRTWTLQTGDGSAADRFYAVASDGAGGAYVAGYTGGSFAGTPGAGDKDAVVARVSATGELLWSRQLGGSGEDKGLAVTATADGVWVAGSTSGAMPEQAHAGGLDGWAALLTDAGELTWLDQVGTSSTDQVTGLVARPDGSVVAVGHTAGDLGTPSRGENDVLARAYGAGGDVLWTRQVGTAQDDRGVTGVAGEDGTLSLVATTYGALGVQTGGLDVAIVPLGADGTPGAARQVGSTERDGADEWDEANLMAVRGADGSVWLTGVTFGAPAGATNAGAGDVFTMRVG